MYSGKGPTLLDVRIDPEEPPPMGMRADWWNLPPNSSGTQ
jgi:hypothetical protein